MFRESNPPTLLSNSFRGYTMTKQEIIALVDTRNVPYNEHNGFMSIQAIFAGLCIVYVPEVSPLFGYQIIRATYYNDIRIERFEDFDLKLAAYFATFAVKSPS